MSFIFKILGLSIILIIDFIRLLLKGATKIYCLVAGIAINLLAIGSVLAVITQQWFALGVFGILFFVVMAILFCFGFIVMVLDRLKERI